MMRYLLVTLAMMICISTTSVLATDSQALQVKTKDFIFIGIDPRTESSFNNSDIYYLREDGSLVVNLTNSEFDSENQAVWRTGGSSLIFSRNSMGKYKGYNQEQSSTSFWEMTLNANGQILSRHELFQIDKLFHRPLRVDQWLLSPNERTIAFVPTFEQSILYVVDIKTHTLRQMNMPIAEAVYQPYQWSTDSTTLGYSATVCTPNDNQCDTDYWEVNLSTQENTRLGSYDEALTHWMPGQHLVVDPNSTQFTLYSDGASSKWEGFTPSLSPDGRAMSYSGRTEAGAPALFIRDLEAKINSAVVTLPQAGAPSSPSWSVDSQSIVFFWEVGNNETLYRVNRDGSDLVSLFSRNVTVVAQPVLWRP